MPSVVSQRAPILVATSHLALLLACSGTPGQETYSTPIYEAAATASGFEPAAASNTTGYVMATSSDVASSGANNAVTSAATVVGGAATSGAAVGTAAGGAPGQGTAAAATTGGSSVDGSTSSTGGIGAPPAFGSDGATTQTTGGNSQSVSTSATTSAAPTGTSGGTTNEYDGTGSDCTGGSQVDFRMVGWATEAGGTTGGKGGTTISVSTGLELQQALNDKRDSTTPLTILVSGTITPENSGDLSKIDVKDLSDVSIIGVGAGADFNGIGIKVFKASNVILRNLKVHHVSLGEKDAISIEGPADHIWVDHCELYAEYEGVDKDYYDGLLDAKADAHYITYSWNYLHDSWKTSLVGFSESDTFDRKLTMHHNRFSNNNSRLPLFRAGQGHVFNNYYEGVGSTGVNSRLGACVKVENNVFNDTRNPWVSAYSDVLGGMELVCNMVTGSSVFDYSGSDTHEPEVCTAQVPYEYSSVLNHVHDVADIVVAHAGVGKLTDPTDY